MSRLLLAFLCLVLSAHGLSCQSRQTNNEFSVPMHLTDNRPFVELGVADQTFHFIVDTGGYNAIDLDAAKKLRLALGEQSTTSGAGEEVVPTWSVKIDSVRIGPKTFTNQRFSVVSLASIKNGLNLPYLDGIIGYNFFADGSVQFDYPAKEIRFLDSYAGKNGTPFEIFAGHIPEIDVEIDGTPTKFIIDTGDRSELTISKQLGETVVMNSHYKLSEEIITGYGIGGPIRANVFNLKKLNFGPLGLSDVVTRIPTLQRGGFAAGDFNGSIGSGILKRYTVTVDYRNKLIYFE